ncbi:MAG TPA: hypothetical protein VN721_14640 [Flavipsychrobacter sp.]|nr:hypothetical protein [Flavipsychrobacter sp.]
MKKDITYHWGEDHLMITLGNRIQPRIRVLFCAEFLFTTGMATIFLLQSFPLSSHFIHWIAALGAAVIYLLASYRFLARMYFHEKVVLDKDGLTIIRKTPFVQHRRQYDWRGIGPLHYAGKKPKSDHTLKGGCFDYFGFETHEYLIQSLHHEGNLSFTYGSCVVHFARGIYSWDAEEMVHIMRLFTGPMLRLGPEWERMLQEHEIDEN